MYHNSFNAFYCFVCLCYFLSYIMYSVQFVYAVLHGIRFHFLYFISFLNSIVRNGHTSNNDMGLLPVSKKLHS